MNTARRKGTRTQRLAKARLLRNLQRFEDESSLDFAIKAQVPQAWQTLEEDIEVAEPKIKITLLLDASVAKYFRALGQGYQARINRILGTYAQLKISEVQALFDHLADEAPELVPPEYR